MKKRRIVLTLCAVLLAGALAQDGTNLDSRLSGIENRLTTSETRLSLLEASQARLEADVGRLASVPTSLARIEEKITALTEKTAGQGNIMQTLGLGIVMSIITWVIGHAMGSRKTQK